MFTESISNLPFVFMVCVIAVLEKRISQGTGPGASRREVHALLYGRHPLGMLTRAGILDHSPVSFSE